MPVIDQKLNDFHTMVTSIELFPLGLTLHELIKKGRDVEFAHWFTDEFAEG
jgi:hypothetical protein